MFKIVSSNLKERIIKLVQWEPAFNDVKENYTKHVL